MALGDPRPVPRSAPDPRAFRSRPGCRTTAPNPHDGWPWPWPAGSCPSAPLWPTTAPALLAARSRPRAGCTAGTAARGLQGSSPARGTRAGAPGTSSPSSDGSGVPAGGSGSPSTSAGSSSGTSTTPWLQAGHGDDAPVGEDPQQVVVGRVRHQGAAVAQGGDTVRVGLLRGLFEGRRGPGRSAGRPRCRRPSARPWRESSGTGVAAPVPGSPPTVSTNTLPRRPTSTAGAGMHMDRRTAVRTRRTTFAPACGSAAVISERRADERRRRCAIAHS
jgi:hypothetical protein